MATEPPEWTFADAWVLTAIAGYGDEGCDLRGLLAAADHMNHLILDDDEVTRGVGRFRASGLVVVQDEHFSLTPQGRALAARRTGNLIGQVHSMHTLLASQDLVDAVWHPPDGVLDAVYAAYTRGNDST